MEAKEILEGSTIYLQETGSRLAVTLEAVFDWVDLFYQSWEFTSDFN